MADRSISKAITDAHLEYLKKLSPDERLEKLMRLLSYGGSTEEAYNKRIGKYNDPQFTVMERIRKNIEGITHAT